MRMDLAAVAKTLGVSEADLQKAVQAARPQPPQRQPAAARPTSPPRSRKELGVATADVQAVLDANRPSHHDDTALVAALVKRFSVTEAKAQAALDAVEKAHEADHEARETAMYAAIAKALGKDADAVQKAFEANRPASRPCRRDRSSAHAADDLHELVALVAAAAGEADERAGVLDDLAARGGPGDDHAASAAEVDQALVAQHPQRGQHRVAVDPEHRLRCPSRAGGAHRERPPRPRSRGGSRRRPGRSGRRSRPSCD